MTKKQNEKMLKDIKRANDSFDQDKSRGLILMCEIKKGKIYGHIKRHKIADAEVLVVLAEQLKMEPKLLDVIAKRMRKK